ncbi:MAG: hypothetical protein GY820_13950 [Gammaproteobacteria bacterium]|nr:hypothetical protein [Gammaproteobacteria bacterium]
MIKKCLGIWLALTIIGCKTIQVNAPAPALLEEVTDEVLTEIRQVISAALHGRKVIIADNVFTRSSKLIIQRKRHLDASGNPVQTRVDEAPFIYQLLKQNNSCFIEEASSSRRYILLQAKCRVLQTDTMSEAS